MINKKETKLIGKKEKRIKRITQIFVAISALIMCLIPAGVALAEGNDPIVAVTNLTTFVFTLVRVIGVIIAIFGVVQFALSFQAHDGTQRVNGLMFLGTGLIIFFVKEILGLIGVSI